MDQILSLRTFGGFQTSLNGSPIVISKQAQSKVQKMLILLCLAGEDGIGKRELVNDLFYSQDNESDYSADLRVTAYRLRKALKDVGVNSTGSEDVVLVREGRYYLNPEIHTEVDALQFTGLVRSAEMERDAAKRLTLGLDALDLYKGEFLPLMSAEIWVYSYQAKFQKEYGKAFRLTYSILTERKNFRQAYEISEKAAKIYPYDEYQGNMIDCLLALDRKTEAAKLYDDTAAKYYAEMGIDLSEDMKKRSAVIDNSLNGKRISVDNVKENLQEKKAEHGPYYCALPGFIDTYHFVTRMVGRTGQSAFIIIAAADTSDGQEMEPDSDRTREVSQLLDSSVGSSIRSGDVYTQYSLLIYLILLMGTDETGCEVAEERIREKFREDSRFRKIRLTFKKFPILNTEVPVTESALNGEDAVCICFNASEYGEYTGEFYTRFSETPVAFHSTMDMLTALQDFYDDIGRPQPETRLRSFHLGKTHSFHLVTPKPILSIEKLTEHKGTVLTILLRTIHRSHSTWQGIFKSMESGKIRNFASELDLISAIEEEAKAKINNQAG